MADEIFQAKSIGRRSIRRRGLSAGAETAGRCSTENSGLLDRVVMLELLIVQPFV
jgi:hypothetical protein